MIKIIEQKALENYGTFSQFESAVSEKPRNLKAKLKRLVSKINKTNKILIHLGLKIDIINIHKK